LLCQPSPNWYLRPIKRLKVAHRVRIRTFIVVSITIVEGDLHIPAITLPSHPIEIISAYDFIVLFQKTDLGIKVLWSATPELSVEE